jgi:hypothetical protein
MPALFTVESARPEEFQADQAGGDLDEGVVDIGAAFLVGQ